jgi:hypothetical protein
VRLATTANIILRGLQANDQADQRQNGIYTASEGEWFRAVDEA